MCFDSRMKLRFTFDDPVFIRWAKHVVALHNMWRGSTSHKAAWLKTWMTTRVGGGVAEQRSEHSVALHIGRRRVLLAWPRFEIFVSLFCPKKRKEKENEKKRRLGIRGSRWTGRWKQAVPVAFFKIFTQWICRLGKITKVHNWMLEFHISFSSFSKY